MAIDKPIEILKTIGKLVYNSRIIRVKIIGFIILFNSCFLSLAWSGYSNSKTVNLAISATDEGSGMGTDALMMFSNDGQNWSAAETFANVKNLWDITVYGGGEADGRKTIYLRLRDSAGNWSTDQIATDVILDRTTPVVSVFPPGGDYSASQTIILTPTESGNVYYTTDGLPPTKLSSLYTSPILIDETTTLKFFAEDLAGNEGTVITQIYNITSIPDGGSPPDILGDIDDNGCVDLLDVGCLYNWVIGRLSCLDDVDVTSCIACDVNADGSVDILDAGCLFSWSVENPSCLDNVSVPSCN